MPTNVPTAASEQPTTPLRVKKGKNGDAEPGGKSTDSPKPVAKSTDSPKPAGATEATVNKADPAKREAELASLVEPASAGGEDAFAKLLAAGEPGARAALIAAFPGPAGHQGPLGSLLLRLGELAIRPTLDRISDPKTPVEVRGQLLMVLAEAPSSAALSAMGELLCERSDTVRTAALVALRSFPPSAAQRALSKRLLGQLHGSDDRLRGCAIDALAELHEVSIIPELIELLSDPDPALGDAARRGLVLLSRQDFGDSGWRWKSWWQKHGAESRLSWSLAGLSHNDALIRSSAQEELVLLSGDIAGYRFDHPKRERELARKRWVEWWQRRGYPVE